MGCLLALKISREKRQSVEEAVGPSEVGATAIIIVAALMSAIDILAVGVENAAVASTIDVGTEHCFRRPNTGCISRIAPKVHLPQETKYEWLLPKSSNGEEGERRTSFSSITSAGRGCVT